MDTILEKLKEAGLTGNESKVYLELTKRGSISANELAKKLSIDRTLAYQILSNLIEKGLASHTIKDQKKYFEAASADNLLNSIKEKESIISSLIPQLKNIERLKEKAQDVKVYEGKMGLKVLFDDILKTKNIMVFGATGKSYEILRFELPHLAKQAGEKGLKGRMITSKNFKNSPMTKLRNLTVKYLEEVNSPATTTVYDDKTAIHVLTDKPIVIIIQNEDISSSYRSYFEFLWKHAKS